MVQFGSEPLYDWAIYAGDLANEVKAAKSTLSGVGIPVTVSEMAYGYQVVRKTFGGSKEEKKEGRG